MTAATNTKGYDGTTSASDTPTITSGSLAAGDTAAFTETYDTKNVGTGKTLTAAGSVNDGNGGNNYAVTFVTNTTGAITARAITVTAATNTKVYDGTTRRRATRRRSPRAAWPRATRRPSRKRYDTKNVGTGKTLTAAGSVNDGNSGNNYTVTFVTNTTGAITARAITVTAATNTKVYDGTTVGEQHADDHLGQPGRRRHGGLHGDLRHQERGHGQDADGGRFGQRRQRRQQLRGDVRHQHDRPDHGPGHHGDGGDQHQGLRRHDLGEQHADRSRRAAWPPATRRPSRKPTTPRTWARARR